MSGSRSLSPASRASIIYCVRDPRVPLAKPRYTLGSMLTPASRVVLRDLLLTIDGDRLRLRLVSLKLAKTEKMREGRGEIQLEFNANVPSGGPTVDSFSKSITKGGCGLSCELSGSEIRVTAQHRDYRQSSIELTWR
jgi:hypothetical protein